MYVNDEIIDQLKYNLITNEIRRMTFYKKMFSTLDRHQKYPPMIRQTSPKSFFENNTEEYMNLYIQSNPPHDYLSKVKKAYADLADQQYK